MSSTARRVHHTYKEYLALEEESSTRHEYVNFDSRTDSAIRSAGSSIRAADTAIPPDVRLIGPQTSPIRAGDGWPGVHAPKRAPGSGLCLGRLL